MPHDQVVVKGDHTQGDIPPAGGSHRQETQRASVHVEDIGLGAALCAPDATILSINGHAAEMIGGWAVKGEKLHHLAANQNETEALAQSWNALTGDGIGWTKELHVRGHEGADLDLQLTAMPVSVGDAKPGWLVIIQNLTESLIHARELEIYAQELSQLHQKNKQNLQRLEEASQSRDDFYALVSHELRTPLTSLKAALEMLSTVIERADQAAIERIDSILHRSTFRLERAIDDLLDLATARSGGIMLDFGPVDLTEIVEEVVDDIGPSAEEKELTVRGPTRQDPLIVRGDEVRLQQITQNLLSNAVKAAPAGGAVRVEIGLDADSAHVSVANPAVQIDPKLKDFLFEPFRKSASGGYQTGAGLGLSVVDALVRAHSGTISVDSDDGAVVFTYTVPLWREDGDE